LYSSETKARLENLVRSAAEDSVKLEQLENHMDHLRRGVTISSISPKAQNQFRKLLNLSEEACQVITQQQILKALEFDNMHGRFEAVDTAHYRTFKWIFEDTSGSEDEETSGDEVKESPRMGDINSTRTKERGSAEVEDDSRERVTPESFIHWLSSGNGIYHISGKLGSGKSTLMKFLCEQKRTKEHLKQWAGMLYAARFVKSNG
jgi:hypothetical protein